MSSVPDLQGFRQEWRRGKDGLRRQLPDVPNLLGWCVLIFKTPVVQALCSSRFWSFDARLRIDARCSHGLLRTMPK